MHTSIGLPKVVLYDDVDDVLIVRVTDEPFGWTAGLDADRRVFYARDGSPLAVVIERASACADAGGLPHAELVRATLAEVRRQSRRDRAGWNRGGQAVGLTLRRSSTPRTPRV